MEDYKGWGTSHMSFKSGEGVHAQLTASYIGRCIFGVVRDNSDVTASSLIEQILMFARYRVKYSKALRAKQHAIALL
jgi:hypothetical protein